MSEVKETGNIVDAVGPCNGDNPTSVKLPRGAWLYVGDGEIIVVKRPILIRVGRTPDDHRFEAMWDGGGMPPLLVYSSSCQGAIAKLAKYTAEIVEGHFSINAPRTVDLTHHFAIASAPTLTWTYSTINEGEAIYRASNGLTVAVLHDGYIEMSREHHTLGIGSRAYYARLMIHELPEYLYGEGTTPEEAVEDLGKTLLRFAINDPDSAKKSLALYFDIRSKDAETLALNIADELSKHFYDRKEAIDVAHDVLNVVLASATNILRGWSTNERAEH